MEVRRAESAFQSSSIDGNPGSKGSHPLKDRAKAVVSEKQQGLWQNRDHAWAGERRSSLEEPGFWWKKRPRSPVLTYLQGGASQVIGREREAEQAPWPAVHSGAVSTAISEH